MLTDDERRTLEVEMIPWMQNTDWMNHCSMLQALTFWICRCVWWIRGWAAADEFGTWGLTPEGRAELNRLRAKANEKP